MKIVIAHFYYDLLNLYGESGNIKALKKYLENQDIDVEIKKVTLFEEINFSDYDCIYLGMGTENNQLIALKHLIQYKKDIKNYINKGGFVIATGNSLELFGKAILDKEGKKHKALDVFPYHSTFVEKRIICESILNISNLEMPIIGFQNRGSIIKNNKNVWMKTIKNFKSENNCELEEGVQFKNFYGTYVIGPLLVRNPHLLEYLAKELILSKNNKFKLKKVDCSLEWQAYEIDRKRYEEK